MRHPAFLLFVAVLFLLSAGGIGLAASTHLARRGFGESSPVEATERPVGSSLGMDCHEWAYAHAHGDANMFTRLFDACRHERTMQERGLKGGEP